MLTLYHIYFIKLFLMNHITNNSKSLNPLSFSYSLHTITCVKMLSGILIYIVLLLPRVFCAHIPYTFMFGFQVLFIF